MQLGFCLFTTPNFELTVQRADRINEYHEQDRILGAIQVANTPRNRNDRQVNQIRVERSAANFTDNTDAEKSCNSPLTRKKRNQEQPIQQNRKRMVEEIVDAGIQFRAHEEKAPVNGGKHNELRNAAHIVALEEIEESFFIESEENHAKQVFKNADGSENMEETVLSIVTVEPEVVGEAKEGGPENARNKEGSKENPERTIALLE